MKLLSYVCRFDILAITETHLDRKVSNSQLEIENYKMVRRDRSLGMVGGGCLVYIANHLCFTRLKSFESTDIEGIWLKIMFDLSAFIVGSIYRPPSDSEFFQRFYITLEKVWLKYKNVIVIGDLNADFTRNRGEIKSAMGKRLHSILQHFDYSVVNDQPTRITSETSTLIDLIIASMPNTMHQMHENAPAGVFRPSIGVCNSTYILLNGLTYNPAEYFTSFERIFPSPERARKNA